MQTYSATFFKEFSIAFPGGSDGKASAYNAGDLGSIPGLERSPGKEKGYPLQYSGLENLLHSTSINRCSTEMF